MSVEIDPPEQLEFNRTPPYPCVFAGAFADAVLSCRPVYTAGCPSLEGDEPQRCARRLQGQDNGAKKVRVPLGPCRSRLC
jgi:hypothetical protein